MGFSGRARVALRRADAPRADLLAPGQQVSGSEVRGICLSGAQADLRKVHGVIGAEIRGKKIVVPDIHKQFDEHG